MYGFYLATGMGYGLLGSMGYGFEFPAYQLGGSKILWVMGEYGLSELWVMRELTVSSRVYASEAACNDYPDGSSLEQLRQGRKQPGQNLG